MEKPKILCLHGFGQSAKVLAHRMKDFMKKNKKFEFIFAEGTHSLPKRTDQEDEEPAFAWYYYSEEKRGDVDWNDVFDKTELKDLRGLQDGMDHVKDILLRFPDVQYILGFSQGAALLSVMAHLELVPHDKKLIFISGFYPGKYDDLKDKMPYQTQHLYSMQDQVIPVAHSEHLSKQFLDAVVLPPHEKGHVFPKFELKF